MFATLSDFLKPLSLVAGLSATLLWGSAAAHTLAIDENAQFKASAPTQYTVRQGDTLWDVAGQFLENPQQAGAAWSEEAVSLHPGDQASVIERGERWHLQIKSQRVVKLSPNVVTTRADSAVETVPLSKIRQFLARPQVAERDELNSAPYIVANAAGKLLISQGDIIYVRGLDDELVGESYIIVRAGQAYQDQGEDAEPLAYEATYLGSARLEQDGDPATLTVTEAARDIRQGDRLLPVPPQVFERDFIPTLPGDGIEGARLIALLGEGTQVGQYQAVVINRGEEDGIERGNVLAVYRGGETIHDPLANESVSLPSLQAGTLLVFKVFEKISYALVVKATRDMHLYDEVALP